MTHTLRSLRAAYPQMFHAKQDWFDGEAFMDTPLGQFPRTTPPKASKFGLTKDGKPAKGNALPLAVELAALYVKFPDDPVWKGYLWCRDMDAKGQRVYVGAGNGKGFEIHRHLHLTGLWAVPTWEGK